MITVFTPAIKDGRKVIFMQHVRKTWGGLHPATRIVPDKTKYNRRKNKSLLNSE